MPVKRIEITRPLWWLEAPYYQAMLITGRDQGDIRILASWPARTTPNIQRPGQGDQPNLEEYPVLAGGIYEGQVLHAGFKGKTGILINGGKGVPAFQHVNPRFPSQGRLLTGVWIHEGQRDAWPGSAGCITLAPGGALWLEARLAHKEKILILNPGPEPGFLLEDVGDYGRK